MSAFAFGPGSGVFSSGASIPHYPPEARRSRRTARRSRSLSRASCLLRVLRVLLALPAGALRAVLEDHAARGHVVADAIGLREVAARGARPGGRRSPPGSRPPASAAAGPRRAAATARRARLSKWAKACRDRRDVRLADLLLIDRGVDGAHQVEHRGEARRRCSDRRTAPRRTPRAPCWPRGRSPGARRRPARASSRSRQSVSRLSASSACCMPVHVKLSCLR